MNYKTITEIAKIYGVTTMGVRYWIKNGLPYKTEKVIGLKPRIVINPEDVDKYLKLGIE